MLSFSLSVRRSSVCFTVSNAGETNVMSSTENENDDMTFVFPPLETVKHTDERRTDNENDDMTFVSPTLETVSCQNP
jgi:hypothetical protein